MARWREVALIEDSYAIGLHALWLGHSQRRNAYLRDVVRETAWSVVRNCLYRARRRVLITTNYLHLHVASRLRFGRVLGFNQLERAVYIYR